LVTTVLDSIATNMASSSPLIASRISRWLICPDGPDGIAVAVASEAVEDWVMVALYNYLVGECNLSSRPDAAGAALWCHRLSPQRGARPKSPGHAATRRRRGMRDTGGLTGRLRVG
jgi:hypothetical protein